MLSPNELIQMPNIIFTNMDELTDQYGLEKIKTIGDCYMAVAGAPIHEKMHALRVANFACSVLDRIKLINLQFSFPLDIRIGIHSGSCIGGIIGKKKFSYDLWGKTINIASRMESHGESGQIHVSDDTYQLLKDQFNFKKRALIMVKGFGEMSTYFLEKKE